MIINQYSNLSQVIDKYDVLLVDLWGVIHDGVEAYPGVHLALESLNAAGKKVVFLSNAPRRAFMAIEGLRNVGVDDGLYDAVVTSGEVLVRSVGGLSFIVYRNNDQLQTTNHKRYIIIGPERDSSLMDGAGYTRVMAVKDADFMVVTGFDEDNSTLAEKQPYLDEAIKYNLPLICANPDLVVVRKNGARSLCAGVIAEKYTEMGGKVLQFGKPYKQVYEYAMQLAGNPDRGRVAAIGDSLITDVKGANDFGIDSYFIAGGIYGEELGIKHGQLPNQAKLKALCDSINIYPKGVLPEFVF